MISPRMKRNLKREWSANTMAKVGAAIILMFVFIAVFAPFIAVQNPLAQNLSASRMAPFQSAEYPLGTDNLGRDVFSRIVYGTRVSLAVGVTSIAVATVIGVAVGLVSGYAGGRVDDALMRITDVIITIPSLMIAVTVFGLLGPVQIELPDPLVQFGLASSEMPETFVLPGTIIFALAFVSWTTFARVARSEALSVKNENYVLAAKSIGSSDGHILIEHILPNSFSPVLVLATLRIGFAILLESSLAFLGFSGAKVSWGRDIALGRDYIATNWWIGILPGVAIILLVIGINLFGDLLRDAFDPNLESESSEI